MEMIVADKAQLLHSVMKAATIQAELELHFHDRDGI